MIKARHFSTGRDQPYEGCLVGDVIRFAIAVIWVQSRATTARLSGRHRQKYRRRHHGGRKRRTVPDCAKFCAGVVDSFAAGDNDFPSLV